MVVVVEDDVDDVIKVLFKSKILDEFDGNGWDDELYCCFWCFNNAREDFFDMARLDDVDDDEEDNNAMGDHKNKFIFLNNFVVWLGKESKDNVDKDVDGLVDVLLEACNFTAFTDVKFDVSDAEDDNEGNAEADFKVEEMLLELKE